LNSFRGPVCSISAPWRCCWEVWWVRLAPFLCALAHSESLTSRHPRRGPPRRVIPRSAWQSRSFFCAFAAGAIALFFGCCFRQLLSLCFGHAVCSSSGDLLGTTRRRESTNATRIRAIGTCLYAEFNNLEKNGMNLSLRASSESQWQLRLTT